MKTVIHSALYALVLLSVLAADVALATETFILATRTKGSADLCD